MARFMAEGGLSGKPGDTMQAPGVLDPFAGAHMDPPVSACGPCDAADISWRQLEVNLVQGRYATVFVDLTVSGGNLVIAKTADALVAFAAGTKENGAKSGLFPADAMLTRAETDAYSEGALGTNIASNYRVVGMQILPGEPFLTGTVGGDPTGRTVLPALDFYASRIARALFKNSHVKFRYGQAEGGYELGRPEFWPAGMGMLSQDFPSNGQPIPRLFMPLRLPTWAGGPTDDNAIEVDLSIDHAIQITADPLVPVPALAGATHYLMPLTFMLMGDPRNEKALTASNVDAIVARKVQEMLAGGGVNIDELVAQKVRAALAAAGR